MSPRQIGSRVGFVAAVLLALLLPPQPASPQGHSRGGGRKPQDERMKQRESGGLGSVMCEARESSLPTGHRGRGGHGGRSLQARPRSTEQLRMK